MATKAMSAMTDADVKSQRDFHMRWFDAPGTSQDRMLIHLILANQYDAELTRREKEKT